MLYYTLACVRPPHLDRIRIPGSVHNASAEYLYPISTRLELSTRLFLTTQDATAIARYRFLGYLYVYIVLYPRRGLIYSRPGIRTLDCAFFSMHVGKMMITFYEQRTCTYIYNNIYTRVPLVQSKQLVARELRFKETNCLICSGSGKSINSRERISGPPSTSLYIYVSMIQRRARDYPMRAAAEGV